MCIEVAADDGTRVLLDLGMPLVAPGRRRLPLRDAAAADRGADRRGRPASTSPASSRTTPRRPTSRRSSSRTRTSTTAASPTTPTRRSRSTAATGRSRSSRWAACSSPTRRCPADLRVLPTDEPVRFGGLERHGDPGRPRGARTRAPCSSRPTVSGCSTPATCGPTGAPASASRSMLRDERLRGVDWLLCEGTTLGSSGGSHGLRSEAEVEDELLALARGQPGQAPRGRRLGPEPRPPRLLLPCGPPQRPPAGHRPLPGLRADEAGAALAATSRSSPGTTCA